MNKVTLTLVASLIACTATPAFARLCDDGPCHERPERPERAPANTASERPERPEPRGFSQTEKQIATRAATITGRAAVGEAIGGTVGRWIGGGAIGTGIGVFLTPTRTGCAALHGC